MYRVTKEIHFCYGHRLLDYSGKCRHLHGHNGRAVITLETESLDALGMVMDFTVIKQVVGKWIDDALDHLELYSGMDPEDAFDHFEEQRETNVEDLRDLLVEITGRDDEQIGDAPQCVGTLLPRSRRERVLDLLDQRSASAFRVCVLHQEFSRRTRTISNYSKLRP